MSKTAPRDLAVAFRSLSRRLTAAATDDAPPSAVDAASKTVQNAIAGAASIMRSAATADAVAAAIESRPSADWTADDLAAVQKYADDAGRSIRSVENLAERA